MIKSMTGYGKQVVDTVHRKYTIEIRTLNSKTLDLNLRIPTRLREHEIDIRNAINKQLERGKTDVMITSEEKAGGNSVQLNKTLAMHYHGLMQELADATKTPLPADTLSLVFRMPDVLGSVDDTTDNIEWDSLAKGVDKAIEQVDLFRIQEGSLLHSDFTDRIQTILSLLEEVPAFEADRTIRIRERIQNSLHTHFGEGQTDPNRLEQEMIYYLEKLDITEEKVRLRNNCAYFLETLELPLSSGKKLGFISQEIGREINTLGSKANDAGLQRLVVLMKDELEKIKEQLFNIL